MKFKQFLLVLGLLISLSTYSLAQSRVLMDIIVVEMPTANYLLLQKQQFLWQNNPQYLITLIESLYEKDKKGIVIVRSQVKANNNEAVVIVGNTQAANIEKRAIGTAHILKVTPKLLSQDQLILLLQDQKNAKNFAKTGGVSFEKNVSQQIQVSNKALTLVAIAKLTKTRQFIFITPTILHEKN